MKYELVMIFFLPKPPEKKKRSTPPLNIQVGLGEPKLTELDLTPSPSVNGVPPPSPIKLLTLLNQLVGGAKLQALTSSMYNCFLICGCPGISSLHY